MVRETPEVLKRSIPACAGEPRRSSAGSVSHRVYPRVCGGTDDGTGLKARGQGLSPRVRGNHDDYPDWAHCKRSIPACAGEPGSRGGGGGVDEVYPRVCGGTEERGDAEMFAEGLSPRVRGNRPDQDGRDRNNRVYPRVCGGTGVGVGCVGAACGLSPRVRGNRCWRWWDWHRRGSIPACAGEPPCDNSNTCPTHGLSPRVRGNPPSQMSEPETAGSIPAVRGTNSRRCIRRSSEGLIPACAGEPGRSGLRSRSSKVYPRVCGGTQSFLLIAVGFEGLSPRVRGNRRLTGMSSDGRRSIPACAGEPTGTRTKTIGTGVYPRVCGGT